MEDRPMGGPESLQLIAEMIRTAKAEQTDDGRRWILWGWLLFSVSLLTVANAHWHWFGTWLFWNVFGLATLLIFGYDVVVRGRKRRNMRVLTYTRALSRKLHTGFF